MLRNRLQNAIQREIRNLVDSGVCSPEMIDDVISFGFGRRMAYTAYFKRMDIIGLDFIYNTTKAGGYEQWPLIAERVERGDIGVKSGKGIYDWSEGRDKKLQRHTNLELIRLMKQDMEAGLI